jgi:hypothetical protein
MAETKKYIAEFEINADGAITNIKKVTDATDDAAASATNLKKEIKQLSQELANTDPQSQKYVDLANKIGKLKDQVGDAAEAIKANAGSAFTNFADNAGVLGSRLGDLDFEGAASAVSGLAGATKKLNFKELGKGAGELGKSLVSLGKALLTNPIFLIGTAILLIITNFDKLLQLFPPLNIAFNAIKEAIGFVTDAIFAFTDAIGLTSKAADDALAKQISSKDQAVSDLDRAERRAKANAKKNGQDTIDIEKQYEKERLAIYNNIIKGLEAKVRAGRTLTEDEVKNLQDAKNQVADIEIGALEREANAADKAREDQKKAEEEAEKKREQKKAEADRKAQERKQKAEQEAQAVKDREKAITETLAQAEEERFQNSLEGVDRELRQSDLKYEKLIAQAGTNEALITQIKLAASQEQSDILKKEGERLAKIEADNAQAAADASKKIREEQALETIALEEQISDELLKAKSSARQNELRDVQDRFFEQKELLTQQGASTAELEELERIQLKEINDRYDQEEKDSKDAKNAEDLASRKELNNARIALAQEGLSILASITEEKTKELGDKIKGIDKSISEAKSKEERARLIDQRKALEGEARKAFNRNKALQIAQALIQTYQSATAAYASQLVIPSPDAPIRAAIAAGAAVGAGLLQVNKIRKTQFDSGSAPDSGGIPTAPVGGAGGGAGGAGGAPNMNGIDLSFLQNRPQQPTRNFVLAGEVSGAQDAREKVENLARLNTN